MIIAIVATAENLAIGKNGKLPWHYPADLKFFKKTTLNHAVVMGYNTWESIGKCLPNRLNIVLSKTKTPQSQSDLIILRSKNEVVSLSKYLSSDVFIIGGAETYQNFADVIEKWIVTEIPLKVEEADVFLKTDFLKNFKQTQIIELEENLRVRFYEKAVL